MFISFMDLDDILIPRLANTYFEEFEILFNMEQFKEANKKLKRSQRVTVVMKEDYDPLPKELQSTLVDWFVYFLKAILGGNEMKRRRR